MAGDGLSRNESPSNKMHTVGASDDFWTWTSGGGWNLTRRRFSDDRISNSDLHLECELTGAIIDPAQTALLIIDMQNYSMYDQLVPHDFPTAHEVQETLLRDVIPAARAAKIQVVWLNWGLTEEDLNTMPPSVLRGFGWHANTLQPDYGIKFQPCPGQSRKFTKCGEFPGRLGLGSDLGTLRLPNGDSVVAGRALMRDTWNAELHGPLLFAYEEGQASALPDAIVHKNRNSGLWNDDSECARFLQAHGLRTLLLAGVNTDQCVLSTMIDAQARGYDTILLRDACATDSPDFARLGVEFNACKTLGFSTTVEAFQNAVKTYVQGRPDGSKR